MQYVEIFHTLNQPKIDLTPQPPSLGRNGKKSCSPFLVGEGLGERSRSLFDVGRMRERSLFDVGGMKCDRLLNKLV